MLGGTRNIPERQSNKRSRQLNSQRFVSRIPALLDSVVAMAMSGWDCRQTPQKVQKFRNQEISTPNQLLGLSTTLGWAAPCSTQKTKCWKLECQGAQLVQLRDLLVNLPSEPEGKTTLKTKRCAIPYISRATRCATRCQHITKIYKAQVGNKETRIQENIIMNVYELQIVGLTHITPLRAHLVWQALWKATGRITPLKPHQEHCFLQWFIAGAIEFRKPKKMVEKKETLRARSQHALFLARVKS